MSYCYLCNKKLCNENPEHIIPNALGGHLKSRHILCKKCNNDLSNIDRKLCGDLELLTNFIAPKRDNNNHTIPSVETTCNGETFLRNADGSYRKSKNIINFDGKNIQFSFSHTPNSAAEEVDFQILKKTLRQFAKNSQKSEEWIQNKISEAINNTVINKDNTGVHHFQFIPNKSKFSFLGVLKIVLGYCAFKKVNKEYLLSAINILKNQNIKECYAISNYFNDNSQLLKDSVYHTLHIRGDTTNNILFAIVSLYGIFTVFVLLSSEYKGVDIDETYCYDLIKNNQKKHRISYIFTLADVNKILKNDINPSIFTDNFNQFMKFFTIKDKCNYLMRVIDEVQKYVFNLIICGGDKLSEPNYRKEFYELFCTRFKEQPDVEFLVDEDIGRFASIVLDHFYTYTWYCYQTEMLQLAVKSLDFIFLSHPDNDKELFELLSRYIDSYQSILPDVNKLFEKDKQDFKKFILAHYADMLRNQNIRSLIFHCPR